MLSDSDLRLLIVGNPEPIHIGAHLYRAAQQLGLDAELCDLREADRASWIARQFNRRVRGHRPARLREFGRKARQLCEEFKPHWLLATGLAPLDAQALTRIRRQGTVCLNYLTDDPWNPSHRSRWFSRALPCYGRICTPRQANIRDLQRAGCAEVRYVPFGYAAHLHFPEPPDTAQEQDRYNCDVLFYGGADRDRLPYIRALLDQGFNVHLYGGYWERYADTRPYTRGHADPGTLRRAVAGAKVTLCLVRRANRDGHVMRTYEAPAMGACLLAEDTPEHREILGPGKHAVTYFSTIEQMNAQVRWLLGHDAERTRMAAAAYNRIAGGSNTYRDRLEWMLDLTESPINR